VICKYSWSRYYDRINRLENAFSFWWTPGHQTKMMLFTTKQYLKLIPAKCTDFIQPANVFFFRQFKTMVKFITDTLIVSSNVKVWHRDNFLRIQSFVYSQFSANRFQNLLRFAFFKCGYASEHPGRFQTPSEYCFESGLTEVCFKGDCGQLAFIRCAHCEKCLCFDHSLVLDLHVH